MESTQEPFIKRLVRGNQKTFGILGLLLLIFVFTGLQERSYWSEANVMNMRT